MTMEAEVGVTRGKEPSGGADTGRWHRRGDPPPPAVSGPRLPEREENTFVRFEATKPVAVCHGSLWTGIQGPWGPLGSGGAGAQRGPAFLNPSSRL